MKFSLKKKFFSLEHFSDILNFIENSKWITYILIFKATRILFPSLTITNKIILISIIKIHIKKVHAESKINIAQCMFLLTFLKLLYITLY